jgi:hypothetical protein
MVYKGHAADYRRHQARGREDRPAVQAQGPGMTFFVALVLYVALSIALSVLGSCMVLVP